MTWKAFVRTTRPSFYALVLKQYEFNREHTSIIGSSSHEELNRPGTFWPNPTTAPSSTQDDSVTNQPIHQKKKKILNGKGMSTSKARCRPTSYDTNKGKTHTILRQEYRSMSTSKNRQEDKPSNQPKQQQRTHVLDN